jgi:hypothetical protein
VGGERKLLTAPAPPARQGGRGRFAPPAGAPTNLRTLPGAPHLDAPPKWTAELVTEIQRRVEAGQGWAQIAREAFNCCDPQAVQNRFRSTARTARPGARVPAVEEAAWASMSLRPWRCCGASVFLACATNIFQLHPCKRMSQCHRGLRIIHTIT